MALEGGREKLGKGMYPPAVEAKMRAAVEAINQTVKKAMAKGVRIGMGTDAAVYPRRSDREHPSDRESLLRDEGRRHLSQRALSGIPPRA